MEDAAIMLQPLAGYDALDVNSVNAEPPEFVKGMSQPVAALRLGLPRAPFYATLDIELPVFRSFWTIIAAEMYTAHAASFATSAERFQPTTRFAMESGAKITAPAYINARRELAAVRRAVIGVFATVDVVVTPTTLILPKSVTEAVADQGPGGAPSLRNTAPFNSYGLPTISVPCGFSRGGLPIGLQITGPPMGESTVLAVARAYEQLTEWHKRMPEM